MACGSTYAHLLRTEDGKTPDDPWDWYAGPLDYDEWYDVAHSIGREVFRRWNWVIAIENKLSKLDDPHPDTPFPDRDALLFLVEDFIAKLDDLGHVLIDPITHPEWTWEPAIRRAIAVARDGTCVLEKLDEATTYYRRPTLPDTKPKAPPRAEDSEGGGGLGGVLMTGALAVAGWLLWRRHTRKERRQ